MSKLKVWTNGTDTVIAESREDIGKIIDDQYGAGSWKMEHDRDDWYTKPDESALRVHWEDQPPGVDPYVTKTCAEWIASEGRGFLCSTEY